jgi:hypothetical protein
MIVNRLLDTGTIVTLGLAFWGLADYERILHGIQPAIQRFRPENRGRIGKTLLAAAVGGCMEARGFLHGRGR